MRHPDTHNSLTFRVALHVVVTCLALVVVHYFFALQAVSSMRFLAAAYSIVAFAFGYHFYFSKTTSMPWSVASALAIGILATTLMSAVVSITFDQVFFPDQQQIADFVERFYQSLWPTSRVSQWRRISLAQLPQAPLRQH